MKKRNITTHLILLLTIVWLFSSCLKIGEYYVGLHLQPDMDNSPFEPGLNVFGVLKTGPDFDTINHRFEIQQLLDMVDWTEGFEVHGAAITLTRVTKGGTTSHHRPIHHQNGLYFDNTIETAPGDEWHFLCVKDIFEVASSTLVPNTPLFAEGRSQKSKSSVSFEILTDSTAFMYLVYLLNSENVVADQQIANPVGNTVFAMDTTWEIEGLTMIYVFAFDKKLREYYTSSNTFFKPNAYRPGFSVVDGGYGVFGSVSSNVLVLE